MKKRSIFYGIQELYGQSLWSIAHDNLALITTLHSTLRQLLNFFVVLRRQCMRRE